MERIGGSAVARRGLTVLGAVLGAAAAIALSAGGAAAGSDFSRSGLGQWLLGYDLRGQMLGGTGIGTIDPFNISPINPASSAFSRNTIAYVALEGSANWADDGHTVDRQTSSRIDGAAVDVPITPRWGLRLSLRPLTDGSYTLIERVVTGSGAQENLRREEGSRGLLLYQADVTWRSGRAFALGAGVGLATGSLLIETEYTFADSGWTDTSDRRLIRFHPSAIFSLGTQWSPQERLGLGAFGSLALEQTLEESYTLMTPGVTAEESTTRWSRDRDFQPAPAAGLGASYFLGPRLRLSADAVWRGWEEARLDGQRLEDSGFGRVRNTLHWGIGIERQLRAGPMVPLLQRLTWRAGFAYLPWYLRDASGESVNESRLSAGVGLPIGQQRGRINLGVFYGWRASQSENGLTERYLRVAFAFVYARVPREY